jgi:hypothetical protein
MAYQSPFIEKAPASREAAPAGRVEPPSCPPEPLKAAWVRPNFIAPVVGGIAAPCPRRVTATDQHKVYSTEPAAALMQRETQSVACTQVGDFRFEHFVFADKNIGLAIVANDETVLLIEPFYGPREYFSHFDFT